MGRLIKKSQSEDLRRMLKFQWVASFFLILPRNLFRFYPYENTNKTRPSVKEITSMKIFSKNFKKRIDNINIVCYYLYVIEIKPKHGLMNRSI